jgi:hypothetical protein
MWPKLEHDYALVRISRTLENGRSCQKTGRARLPIAHDNRCRIAHAHRPSLSATPAAARPAPALTHPPKRERP